ncbi:bacteriocin [Neisseria yangbaofengii]
MKTLTMKEMQTVSGGGVLDRS